MLLGELDMAEHSIGYARPFCQAENWPLGCEGVLDAIPSELSVCLFVILYILSGYMRPEGYGSGGGLFNIAVFLWPRRQNRS